MTIIKIFRDFAVVSTFVAAIVFVMPVTAQADGEWGPDYYGGFGSDYSYDWGGSDYSYDWGSDYSYDYGNDYSYDWGNDYSYDWGNDYAYTYEPYNDYAYTYEPSYNDYAYTYEPYNDYAYTYEPSYNDYAYTYEPSYSYSSGSFDYGCGSSCGGSWYTPSYSTGCGSWCGTGGGQYVTPRFTAPSSSYTNIVTNNVDNSQDNDNYNYITNIDNSIRDSFNNYNSGNTSIVVTAPQTPVQTTPAPYCTITHAQYGGYGSGAYLSWTSTNASSAYLTNVGSVAVSGSQMVYPHGSQTYTLTVHGYNGQTATCATSVYGQVYVPPTYNPPYVSLTQIPYTGFDFGPIGNAMYWVSLLGFAAAGAYLMIYYRGGALAFATAMVPARKFQPVVAPKAPILIEKEAHALSHDEVKVQPIVASLRKAAGTLDTMAIVASKDGSMPRIVIQRA
jgi:hypothetical protein